MLWFARVVAAQALMATAIHGIRPIVTYQALAIGASPAEIGIIAASFGFLALFTGIAAGQWVDRSGEKAFMVGGLAAAALSTGILVTANSVATMIVGMTLLGLSQMASVVAIQTMVANGGDPKRQDERFAMQTLSVSIGQLAGPALATFVAGAMSETTTIPSLEAISVTLVVFTVILALATALGLTLVRWPPLQHARDTAVRAAPVAGSTVMRVLRAPSMPHALLASMAILAAMDIVIAYYPAFAASHGIGIQTVGLLLAVRAAGAFAGRAVMIPLLRRMGRRKLILASLVVPGLAVGTLPVLPDVIGSQYAAMALIGIGLGIGGPLTLSWVAARAPFDVRSTALGVRLSANRLAQFVLPVGAAVVAGTAGVGPIFFCLTAVLGLGAVSVLLTDFE